MFTSDSNIFEESHLTEEQQIPLQTRILNSVYTSLKGLTDEDPIENIRDFVNVCGEKYIDIHPQEVWPQSIFLYQQFDVHQILLPDNANCLAVQAYLKMCNLEYSVESRWNAEYMSPSGKVPFIKCGALVISDFDNIVSFINNRGIGLSQHLTDNDKANLRAYISLVNNVLYYAELYICWCHDDTYNNLTKKRYGIAYPWPLNHYMNWRKRNQIIKKLSIFPWAKKSLKQVLAEVKKCCDSLSKRLAGNKYFFGDKPNELDALVFSHINILTTTNFPSPMQELAAIIHKYPNLIKHASLINKMYFKSASNNRAESFELIETSSEESIISLKFL